MPDFDPIASTFDLYRGLPSGIAESIRLAILKTKDVSSHPRVLDLGAGTGRIGGAFVDAGDWYVAIDSSFAMLREFAAKTGGAGEKAARLVQGNGEQLPFCNGIFDVVLLIQVLNGARHWRKLLKEARRVLKLGGRLVIGQIVTPPEGIDSQLKERLATILEELGVTRRRPGKGRDEALAWVGSICRASVTTVAASWISSRTPRDFLARHRTGARFAALPASIQNSALALLSRWAEARFGSLDVSFPESYAFELHTFAFH
jgi:ubiquinone/menaquinone biosynthesis C-methylase UbiE